MRKGGRDHSVLPNNWTDRGVSRVTSLFVSHQENKRSFFLFQTVCELCSQGTMQFLSQQPKSPNYKVSPLRSEKKKGRRKGSSLTIAAWADINLFKLMEVSILLCYGGMSNIPGHPSYFITRCSSSNNSKSLQIVS